MKGRMNPNCRYWDVDDDMFKEISSDEVAYLLGWIASDGTVRGSQIQIMIHNSDRELLECLARLVSKLIPIKEVKGRDMVCLTFNSEAMSKDVCRHLRIVPGKKSRTVRFPSLLKGDLGWSFLRGYFDGDGNVFTKISPVRKSMRIKCSLYSGSEHMISDVVDFTGIHGCISKNNIQWSGKDAVSFLSKIYPPDVLCLERKADVFDGYMEYRN